MINTPKILFYTLNYLMIATKSNFNIFKAKLRTMNIQKLFCNQHNQHLFLQNLFRISKTVP